MTPDALLAAGHGLVVAPAGCGKTHLLSETVRANPSGRILVLTHTRAGVAVIRNRLRSVRPSAFRVSTFDAWASWIANQFPRLSGFIPTGTPMDYDRAKQGALRLLTSGPIKSALTATYSRALVDEYQDCNRMQFAMVGALMTALPTIAFADPMQAIFGFNDDLPPWHETTKSFETTWTLSEPHRWTRAGEETFGRWILKCRDDLEHGRAIDFTKAPTNVQWVPVPSGATDVSTHQLRAIAAAPTNGTLLVINDSRQFRERRTLARSSGRLAVVETADLPDLKSAAERISVCDGFERVDRVLDFAESVMADVDRASLARRVRQVASGASPPECEEDWALYHAQELTGVAGALTALRRNREVFRPDLFDCMHDAARVQTTDLVTAAARVRSRRLEVGRRVESRAIGSTLLLKGLEADHVVALDVDGMNRQDLYVAISRGSRTLTVVSRSPVLPTR